MSRKNDSIFQLLIDSPWWVSPIFSVLIYFSLGVLLPSIELSSPILSGFQLGVSSIAHWIALFFLLPAPLSFLNAKRKRVLLERQNGIDSIKELAWKEFEELVGEAYRRMGYRVIENTAGGADGGVDLRLVKDGDTTLVQCKQWRNQKVGVKTVREMYGVMIAEQAESVVIVCSGFFTKDAVRFAEDKPIELIAGDQLQSMIAKVQSNHTQQLSDQKTKPALFETQGLNCPRCDSGLVLRQAKRGKNAGTEFYGCSGFPKCRFTKEL